MSATGKDISEAVREICLCLPQAEEVPSRGSPDFRVKGKTFATYIVNHHGDGRVCMWLNSPAGAQELYVEMEGEYYFVPPYVGPRGWLGVELDKGLSWQTIAQRVREAYEHIAPAALCDAIGATIEIVPPDKMLDPVEIDPFQRPRAKEIVPRLAELCLSLPETSQTTQFGNPVWKAGKKTFVTTHYWHQHLAFSFWVGGEQQAMLTYDDRYSIPAYTGHNGWIELNVEDDVNWTEVEELVLSSYRHFALKRMLRALEES